MVILEACMSEINLDPVTTRGGFIYMYMHITSGVLANGDIAYQGL